MSTAEVAVKFDSGTLHRSKRGAITGAISFRFGAFSFPSPDWSDFVVVVVCWWLQALRALEARAGASTHLQFMDGPYRVRVLVEGPGLLRAECLEDREEEMVVHTAVISTVEFSAWLRRVATAVVAACEERGWSSDDLDVLRREVAPA